MEKVRNNGYVCLILIISISLFPTNVFSDEAKPQTDEKTNEYYQTLLQAINLINFSLNRICSTSSISMIKAEYTYILNNIDLDKVNFPEEIKNRVFFELPKELPEGEKILIVGGGNTAAELACILSGKCDVYLSYRRPDFFRINEENLRELEKRKDQITFFLGTEIKALEPEKEAVKVIFHDGHTEVFSKIFYCLGGSTPRNLLEKMGIKFKDSLPDIDEFGESNLERVFLIGDVAVKRGSIIYAFNSAHRAVERILEKYHILFNSSS